MRKPVLPIADSAGDAKAVYLRMLRDWSTLIWMPMDERSFHRLGRPAISALDAALELIEQIANAS